MAISILSPQALPILQTQNQYVPDEGPKGIPLFLSFTDGTTNEFDLDLEQWQSQGWLSMVQCIYIDMSQATSPLTVSLAGGFQNIVAKVNTQGYYSVLCPNPVKIKFLGTANMGKVTVILVNVPIAGHAWATV